ncbi:hypothetical protein J3492_09335 [Psychrobacter sp. F1192]|uniref:Uncharacterized protein n=1 Tax=Psychrobacter coccoides TaxID=2818440 RepID=A0ABS3NPR3_9GAMM|nr:hypothetical protein [Psychrobacter coccoides]MBO1531411.1 hypothetical protein [Psychrobacter coccoides]
MSNSQHNEQDKLQKYLEEKAKQEQQQEKQKEEPAQLSAYEACVLRESAKIHELIAEAQKKAKEHSTDE